MISLGRMDRYAVRGRRFLAGLIGKRPSRDAAHFQRMYDADPDPWHFRSSDYEREKYRKSLEALPPRRFRSVFEVGCSIGVLTHLLATRCDALLGVDIVEQPLGAARATCSDQPWVRFQRMQVPGEWPDRVFDLIVLSEVLYFLSKRDVGAVAERVTLNSGSKRACAAGELARSLRRSLHGRRSSAVVHRSKFRLA